MYIDTHAHIYSDAFHDQYDEVVDRAVKAQIQQILMPNIDVSSMSDVINLHQRYPEVCLPMVGLHPCSVDSNYREALQSLQVYLTDSTIIAVGEIGIDLYWDTTYEKEQIEAFATQIQWAKEADLPIVIHSRSAIDRTIAMVREHQDGSLRGVFHCFSEGVQEVEAIMELGFYVGIGGVVTFKKNQSLRDTIAATPLSRILLETDAPYLAPMPYRGKRNESSYIPHIAQVLADVYKTSITEIGAQTTQNAKDLFRL